MYCEFKIIINTNLCTRDPGEKKREKGRRGERRKEGRRERDRGEKLELQPEIEGDPFSITLIRFKLILYKSKFNNLVEGSGMGNDASELGKLA